MQTVAWFSAGVSSAVAIKEAVQNIGVDKIIYIHIEDQHSDTLRFVNDCEVWFGTPVLKIQSPLMSVENACRAAAYVNGPRGACCTRLLKKRVRKEWELEQTDQQFRYIWGMDIDEVERADKIRAAMPEYDHLFPLIDYKITKTFAHQILAANGIARPKMYDLGYHNNNCVGCIKGGKGYWNHIRKDFPEVFERRARMERVIGATCIKHVYLDELSEDAGRHDPPLDDDCGIYCQLMSME